jgi:hypothetical protein
MNIVATRTVASQLSLSWLCRACGAGCCHTTFDGYIIEVSTAYMYGASSLALSSFCLSEISRSLALMAYITTHVLYNPCAIVMGFMPVQPIAKVLDNAYFQ